MRHILYIALSLLCTAAMMSGCSAVGCTDNQNSIPLAGFYSYSTGEAIAIPGLAIGGVGAPGDSLLIGSGAAEKQVYLPFRSTRTSTSFYILYKQLGAGVTDTVTFTYESIPYFASEECGAMYHYRIRGVSHTSTALDSVGLTDSLVTNIERETIRLYFRTSAPSETSLRP